MRITREALLKLARDTVDRRTRADRSLLSVYLCGSLLGDSFLLGGTADIDLVFLHTDTVSVERELVPLNDEVHFDIAHHFHRDYRQTRKLRVHPWLGPTLKTCLILYDPQHFMDFTQASVRGQFERADYVLERARGQAEHARQMWAGFHAFSGEPGPKEMATYLRAIDHAANAIASLSGPPLTERRFTLDFPARAGAVGKPGLAAGLLGLLGAPNIDADTLKGWLPQWRAACEGLPIEETPARLHPLRRAYYLKAFEALLKDQQPLAALWPLVHSWTAAAQCLPDGAAGRETWAAALERLALLGPGFHERLAALDAYLDLVEETLEEWARKNGAYEE